MKHPGFMRAQAIVSHPEHDTVYVKDPACRSFSHVTLQTFIQIILDNMPTGAAAFLRMHGGSSVSRMQGFACTHCAGVPPPPPPHGVFCNTCAQASACWRRARARAG